MPREKMRFPLSIWKLCLSLLVASCMLACQSKVKEIKTDNQKASDAFIEKVSKDPSYTAIPFPNSLYQVYYKQRLAPKQPVSKPLQNSKVKIRYTAKTIDGKIFDGEQFLQDVTETSPDYIALKEAVTVDIFDPHATSIYSRIFSGMSIALQYMGVGEKGTAVIPWQLAYGSQSFGEIEGYSAIILDLELVSIVDLK